MQPTLAPLPYASFWKRFHAYGYDSILVALLCWAVGSAIGDAHAQTAEDIQALVNAGLISADAVAGVFPKSGISGLFGWSDMLLPIVVSATYNIAFLLGDWQATPGKRFCGIMVVNRQGGRITLPQATARYFIRWASGMMMGLPFLTVAFTREKVAPHDMMCDTRVILRKAPAGSRALAAPVTTRASMLEALLQATQVSDLPISPSSPAFAGMLADMTFASQAHTIIAKKISNLQADSYNTPAGASQNKTVRNWQMALVRIEQIMAHGSSIHR